MWIEWKKWEYPYEFGGGCLNSCGENKTTTCFSKEDIESKRRIYYILCSKPQYNTGLFFWLLFQEH